METVIDNRLFELSAIKAAVFNNDTFLSDVIFNLNNLPQYPANSVSLHISLENCMFPNSSYTLNSTNNRFRFTITGGGGPYLYDIVIPSFDYGNYDADGFAKLLNDRIAYYASVNNFPSIILVSYNYVNNKLVFTYLSNTPYVFFPDYNLSTMRVLLGLTDDDIAFRRFDSVTFSFSAIINLANITQYIIQIKELPIQNYSLQLGGPFFITILNNAGLWGYTNYQNTTNQSSIIPVSYDLSTLSFQIYDQNGSLVNFNNVNWQCTIRLTYTKQHSRHQTLFETLKMIQEEAMVEEN